MSDQGQLNLFGEEDVKLEKTAYLHVILNGNVKMMSLEELFDTEVYSDLKAITFVASHKFFFKTAKRFKSIQLVLGIEDGHVAGNFAKGLESLLDIESSIDYFQSLPKDVQQEIQNNQF